MAVEVKVLPEIRFKLAWQNYSVGDCIRPVGMLRSFLIDNGYAELVPTERRRGRPRKVK